MQIADKELREAAQDNEEDKDSENSYEVVEMLEEVGSDEEGEYLDDDEEEEEEIKKP